MNLDDEERVITLDVCREEGRYVLQSREVTIEDLRFPNSGWLVIETEFEVMAPDAFKEFRGLDPSSGYEIRLSQLLLEPLAPQRPGHINNKYAKMR